MAMDDLHKRILENITLEGNAFVAQKQETAREPIKCQCGQAAEVIVVTADSINHQHIYAVECEGKENDCWRGPSVECRDAAIDAWNDMMWEVKMKDLINEWRVEKEKLEEVLAELGQPSDEELRVEMIDLLNEAAMTFAKGGSTAVRLGNRLVDVRDGLVNLPKRQEERENEETTEETRMLRKAMIAGARSVGMTEACEELKVGVELKASSICSCRGMRPQHGTHSVRCPVTVTADVFARFEQILARGGYDDKEDG